MRRDSVEGDSEMRKPGASVGVASDEVESSCDDSHGVGWKYLVADSDVRRISVAGADRVEVGNTKVDTRVALATASVWLIPSKANLFERISSGFIADKDCCVSFLKKYMNRCRAFVLRIFGVFSPEFVRTALEIFSECNYNKILIAWQS